MSFDVSAAKSIVIPEGGVLSITSGDDILWQWGGDEYEKLPYIESSGTQYIDTGIYYGGEADVIEVSVMASGTSDTAIYGCYVSSDKRCELGTYRGKYRGNIGAQDDTPITDIGGDDILVNAGGIWSIDGYDFGDRKTDPITEHSNLLFARWYSGSASKHTAARVYWARYTRGGEVIQHLIPCKRLSDGEIGMYDLIGGEFYTNQGTGSFTTETEEE